MTKHIVDKPHSEETGAKLREFVRIEKSQKPNAATLETQRREHERGSGRVEHFVKKDKEG